MRTLHLTTDRRSFFEQQIDALRDLGVECDVLEVPGEYAADDPRTASDYARYAPRVLRRAREYDLVHANYGLVAPFALAQPTRPVVVTFWGTDLMGEYRWLRQLSRTSARLADRVVLPSRRLAPHVPGEYAHVPFPVDTDLFRPIPRGAAREALGWDPEERVVVFPYDPARPEKRHGLARRVVDEAAVDADLRVVTGEPYERMPLVFNAADALLVTSSRESGPMVVREAAACDAPVVATDVGFVRETLASVSGSAVCETDRELVAALEEVLADRRRSDGRETLEGLSPGRMAGRLVDLYESALAERGSTAALDGDVRGGANGAGGRASPAPAEPPDDSGGDSG